MPTYKLNHKVMLEREEVENILDVLEESRFWHSHNDDRYWSNLKASIKILNEKLDNLGGVKEIS